MIRILFNAATTQLLSLFPPKEAKTMLSNNTSGCSHPLTKKWLRIALLALLLNLGCCFQPCSCRIQKMSTVTLQSSSDTDEDYYLRLKEDDEASEAAEEKEKQSSISSLEAIKAYHEKQRQKREWSFQLEEWKRLGIRARRNRRRDLQQHQRVVKAQRMAKDYLINQAVSESTQNEISEVQLELATAFFARLLDHLRVMEQAAYERGKQRAIQREMEIVTGKANDKDAYLEELAEIREREQAQRREMQERIFELPDNWETTLSDEELLTILKIRGNIKNVGKVQKRETIERYVYESFVKPLF